MHSYGTSVLFVCQQCKASFYIVDDFIEHKKEEHSVEFRTSNCIIFEDILIFNTSNDDDDDEDKKCGTVSTVKEKDSTVPLKEDPNLPVIFEIDNSLTNLDFGISRITQQNSHDDPLADSCKPFPITRSYFKEGENNDTQECTRSYPDDDDEASDYILQANHDNQETVQPTQASANVYLYVIELESGSEEKKTESVDLNQFPQNPYVLLKKLSSKEIQSYCRLQNQETVQAKVAPESQCRLCLTKFNSEADLQIHSKICILNNKRQLPFCVPCKKFFNSKWTENIHRIRHHRAQGEQRNLPKNKCHICQKSYSRKTLLRNHMKSHKKTSPQIKPFKCDQCSSSFSAKYCLTRHQAIHGSTRPFQCLEPDCGKAFKIKDHLTNHVKYIHANVSEPFICPEPNCTSAFKYKSSFERHFRTFHAFHKNMI